MQDLTTLTLDLIAAKKAENEANSRRVALEEQIISILGVKEEGAATHDVEGIKLTITGKLSYKADMDVLAELCKALPKNMRPIKTEPKLDETGCKYLRNNEPEAWKQIAAAITIKPAKPSVTIKV